MQDHEECKKLLRRPIITALLILLLFLCCFLVLQPLPKADTWWMLKSGEVILQEGRIPTHDPFSFTAHNLPWIHHEWLAGIILFLLYRLGGFHLLFAITLLIIIASYLILVRTASIKTYNCPVSAILAAIWMIAVSGGRFFFDIRAYLFSYLFLAITLYILEVSYRKKRTHLLYYLIPVTIAWVNMHGSFILSYILQGIFLFSVLFEYLVKTRWQKNSLLQKLILKASEEEIPEKKTLQIGTIVFMGSFLAGLINPYTWKMFLYPFSFWGDSFYKAYLIEWIPPDLFNRHLPFTLTAAGVFTLVSYFRKSLRLTDIFILFGFSYLALTVVRHSVLYSFAMIPTVAVCINELYQWSTRFYNTKSKLLPQMEKIAAAIILASVLIFSYYSFRNLTIDTLTMESTLFPKAGVEFLRANPIKGPMYNPYEWGGYLSWKLYPEYLIFIDGRANTLYPEELFRESIYSMRGYPEWEAIMDKHGINFILCNKYLRDKSWHYLPDRLEESSNWTLVFEDDVEKIFVRNSPENYLILKNLHENNLIIPGTPYQLAKQSAVQLQKNNFALAEDLLQEALDKDPKYLPALIQLGYIKACTNQDIEAVRFFTGFSLSVPLPIAHYNLGLLYEKQGNINRAKRHYHLTLRYDPHNLQARQKIEQLAEIKK